MVKTDGEYAKTLTGRTKIGVTFSEIEMEKLKKIKDGIFTDTTAMSTIVSLLAMNNADSILKRMETEPERKMFVGDLFNGK